MVLNLPYEKAYKKEIRKAAVMEPLQQDSRHKRLKVGRACYTCRAKKIKCDGLRPCMQCKARNRPCTFYKDGSFDPDQELPEDMSSAILSSHNSSFAAAAIPPPPPAAAAAIVGTNKGDQQNVNSEQSDSPFLFADTKDSNYIRNKRRGPPLESRTSNALATLGDGLRKMGLYDSKAGKMFEDVEPFGSFIKWTPEPPLPSRYTGSIEMPSRNTQMKMIHFWFQENYGSLPIVPKRYFYDQLDRRGPFITPLLLNAIYAQASRFIEPTADLPKPDVFFHRAKRLIDDFMDMPRISTVVALCYMSLHEPVPSTHRNGSPHCRSWMYSGMAYRMCLELGLHNQANISKDLLRDDIELRRRVFWACYTLDKLHSGGWERPWMLSLQMTNTDLPGTLPDDDEEEQLIVTSFVEKIKFARLTEEVLIMAGTHITASSSSSLSLQSPSPTCHKKDQIEFILNQYYEALRKLPVQLQWTPTSIMSVQDVIHLPVPRPMVASLHLCFTQCVLDALFRAPNNAYNQFQRRLIATCITQLVHFICEKPGSIVKFDFIVHAILSAIKVHVKHLYSSDATIARQSWAMFDRSIMAIHKLRRHAVIPNSNKFLQQLGNTIEGYEALASQSSSHQHQEPPSLAQPIPPPHIIPLSEMAVPPSDDLTMYATHQPTMYTSAEQQTGDYVVLSMTHHGWTSQQQQQQQQQQQRHVMPVGSEPSTMQNPLLMEHTLTTHEMMMGGGQQVGPDMIQLPHLHQYGSPSSSGAPPQQQQPPQQADLHQSSIMAQNQQLSEGSLWGYHQD